MSYQQKIAQLLGKVLESQFELNLEQLGDLSTQVEVPRDKSHGDFAFPCFRLAKSLRKSPALIAVDLERALAGVWSQQQDLAAVKVLGPYLNFTVNKTALAQTLIPAVLDNSFLARRDQQAEKVMIEYSQPNTHKAFHVGHTRNVALGDALARIFEWCGHPVVAANYIGDEGAHIAKCLWYFRTHFKGEPPQTNLGEFLGELYTKATIMLDFSLLSRCPMPGLTSARVLAIRQHPSRDQWRIVELQTAQDRVEVVCGAEGFKQHDVVAYAPPGSRVGGRVVAVVDKEGVSSKGVICSQKELGFSEDHQNIYVFPAETEVGVELVEYFRIKDALPAEQKVAAVMEERTRGVAQTLKLLEAKEGEVYRLWEKTKAWSMDEFHRIYDWLGARFDHYFYESEVGDAGKQIVFEYLKKGVFVKSEGAVGIDLNEDDLGFFLLLKSNGSGLYATKDLSLAKDKFDLFNIDHSVYVVDASQSRHFQQVFRTLEKMGYEKAQNCYHLAYGLVVLPDGKMSSRAGNVILFSQLKNLLDQRIKAEFLEKYRGNWDEAEINQAAQTIAVATIRYGMLNQDNIKNIVFDLQEWTARSGNTGPYLLYAYTRTRSILRELGAFDTSLADWELLSHETEQNLLNGMAKFHQVVARAKRDYKPVYICQYLYQLCKDFSRMFDKCSVLYADSKALQSSRAQLVDSFGRLLRQGLALLGIQTLERM